MIVIREVFKLKFGKAKDAVALWKEGKPFMEKYNHNPTRVMMDYVSTFYTMVLETEYNSFSDFEESMQNVFNDEEYKTWYQRFIPLTESGYREIFKIIDY